MAHLRPVELRHAVIGGALIVAGAYVGAAAVWSWLFWADQHLDAPRVTAVLLAWVAVVGGWTLIRRWLDGEWFEGGRRWGDGSPGSSNDASPDGPSDGQTSCDTGYGGDGGSCSA